MFAKYDDAVTATPEGIESLVQARICTPDQAESLRASAALMSRLDQSVYRLVEVRDGVDHSWCLIEAQWDGQPLEGDPNAEITEAVKPLACHFHGFSDGMFQWAVQAPSADDVGVDESVSSRRRRRPTSDTSENADVV